jgi:hypothetical protein
MNELRVKRRDGFSRVEVVVVFLIIVVFGGLFLIWAGRGRVISVGITVNKNIREVALALINYESSNLAFPRGFDPETGQSFYRAIASNIEAEALVGRNGSPKPSSAFLCPERRMVPSCAPGTAPADFGFAKTTLDAQTVLGGQGTDNKGRVSFTDFKDGTDFTLLLTLVSIRPPDYPGRNGVDSPWPSTNYGRPILPLVRDTDPEAGDTRLGGPYEKAVPCAFAGGSVRMVMYDIDETQLKALWTFNGGDQESMPKLP